MPTPAWPALMAAVCAAGLLFAFQQVVYAGVQQGEARNRASAAHAEAASRCDFTRDMGQRATCHALLSAASQLDSLQNKQADTPFEAVTLARR